MEALLKGRGLGQRADMKRQWKEIKFPFLELQGDPLFQRNGYEFRVSTEKV